MEFAEELAPGRAVAVDLATGGRVAGCVHALDAAAGLVTLEEAESARLVLVALAQVKKVETVAGGKGGRKWPPTGAFD